MKKTLEQRAEEHAQTYTYWQFGEKAKAVKGYIIHAYLAGHRAAQRDARKAKESE